VLLRDDGGLRAVDADDATLICPAGARTRVQPAYACPVIRVRTGGSMTPDVRSCSSCERCTRP
jgi:hypothetical protein